MDIDVGFMSESTRCNTFHYDKLCSRLKDLVNDDFDNCKNDLTKISASIVDDITQVFIGNKKVRFGNYPSEFCLESIRDIILRNILNDQAIPIVVPMGPHKTIVGEDIDLAELYALKTLASLNNRVSQLYPKGLIFYLRGEDITGWFLTGSDLVVRQNIEQYLTGFEKLIHVLGYDKFIIPFRESQLTNYEEMNTLINIFLGPLSNYFNDTDMDVGYDYTNLTSYRVLQALGWRGHIPYEQRHYYKERFKYHYPEHDTQKINEMIIKYLAISYAKAKLGALFPETIKDYYVQLTFAPPVPGVPIDIVSRRVYYRTLPTNISRMHLPFWRAKGFLILNEHEVNLGINNWYSGKKFYKHKIKLQNNIQSVILSADINVANS